MATRYEVFTNHDVRELTARINRAIAEGWVPVGGITIGFIHNREIWAQAMLKKES